jgi:hypothetical protein
MNRAFRNAGCPTRPEMEVLMAEEAALNGRWRNLKTRVVHEFKSLLVMFLYLWVVFGLFVLDQTVILAKQNISYSAQGFALINALVLAKVMLVAEDLKLGHRFKDRPLIYPILYKACIFAILFILFHTLEKTLVGVLGGKTAAESFPHIGGGSLKGVLCVWAIMFVSLIPFFAIREIGRVIGEDELWNLIFRRGTKAYVLTSRPQQP